MRTSRSIGLIVFPLAVGGFLLARTGAAIHAQGSAPAKAPEYVTYKSGMGQWLSAPHTAELSQGVQFGQGDATLKTDAAVALFDNNQQVISAKAEGPVHIFDPQDDLTGQHGTVDFTKHLATLRDNIVLVVKPGKREATAPGGALRKQFKDPATLTCSEMTYDYRYKIGRIPGPLTVTQVIQTQDDGLQTRTLTADAGLYNGKAQTIQLVGDIKGTYSDGSVIQGDTRLLGKPVLINIKEGSEAIFVPFNTQGHFTVHSQPNNVKDSTNTDDEPDLTLPVPPPHVPGPSDAPVASAPPPPSSAPAAQTPAAPTAPAGKP